MNQKQMNQKPKKVTIREDLNNSKSFNNKYYIYIIAIVIICVIGYFIYKYMKGSNNSFNINKDVPITNIKPTTNNFKSVLTPN